MEFDYTPEQIQLRREVREFAAAEIAPHVLEWDESQTFPLAVIKSHEIDVEPGAWLDARAQSILITLRDPRDAVLGLTAARDPRVCARWPGSRSSRRPTARPNPWGPADTTRRSR